MYNRKKATEIICLFMNKQFHRRVIATGLVFGRVIDATTLLRDLLISLLTQSKKKKEKKFLIIFFRKKRAWVDIYFGFFYFLNKIIALALSPT